MSRITWMDESLSILIESQWNLNLSGLFSVLRSLHINRITVEFKCVFPHCTEQFNAILIESQWNLNFDIGGEKMQAPDINRITVEFKYLHNQQLLENNQHINRITVEFKDRSKVLLG